MKIISIHGINIWADSKNAFLLDLESRLQSTQKPLLIFTPNAENLLRADNNQYLHQTLFEADYNLPDSASLLWSAARQGKGFLASLGLLFKIPFGFGRHAKIAEKISGADIVIDIFQIAAKYHYKVALVGGADGAAQGAAFNLKNTHPNLEIVYANMGITKNNWHLETLDLVKKLNDVAAEIILCAFGCPKQEMWCYYQRDYLTSAKLLIGVGGTLEFISGQIKRAPFWMRQLNLEWLWRLAQQPSRLGRIYTALIKFIFWDLKT